jgi:adenylate kinase
MIYFARLLQDMMLIGLTGTPGCGKTEAAKILGERGYNIISLNDLARKKDCFASYDKERDSHEVDLERLDDIVQGEYSESDLIIEGHLSHFLSVDKVIILRCDPLILRERLNTKGWSPEKVKENVDAEILDAIKVEAHEEDHEIFEIDTSRKDPNEVADSIQDIISGEYVNPTIGWLEKYEYILFESS